jgi:glycosyltransferase involved in cell wall biosynthesis
MTRVLMVSSLWPPVVTGGAELYASALAGRLRSAGHDVGVVTMGVDGPEVVEEVRPWPYRLDAFVDQSAARRAMFHAFDVYRPATARVLARGFAEFRPDVVHTHSVQGLSSAALEVPSRQGIAHVHTLHDYWLLCQRTSLVARDGTSCEQLCRGCAAVSFARNAVIARHPPHVVIAISDAVAGEHARLAWTRDRVRVVHHPVEWERLAPARSVTAGEPVVFGYLGQLTGVKGVAMLLDAFSSAGVPGARLVVAGDGAARDELHARAGSAVEFTGWLDPPARAEFLDRIDCLVVPSVWKEPAGLVVNEARGHFVPVIAARIGGIPELVPQASQALLFDPGDREQLACRLAEFAADPARYRETERGPALDWDAHLALVVNAYADARRAASRVRA